MLSKYKLSPSSSERFLTCTASLPYNQGFSENVWSLKGSLQHDVAFLRLDQIYNGKDHEQEIERLMTEDYISKNDPNLKTKWDASCTRTVDNYITYIKKMYDQFKPKEIYLEYRVNMKFHGNDINGIVDCAMVLPNNDLIIIDLKTGRTKVDTEDNNQLLMYAYGMLQDLNKKTKIVPQKIIVSIVQSIINNTNAVAYKLKQMVDWYVSHAQAMHEINTDKLVFRPTPMGCKYCQHRNHCNARIKAGVV